MDIQTCDGTIFNLNSKMTRDCKVLTMMREDVDDMGGVTQIPNINSNVMKRIIYFNTFGHLEDHDDMINLLLACDYLDYEELLDYGARIVADSLRGRSATEIRAFFGMV